MFLRELKLLFVVLVAMGLAENSASGSETFQLRYEGVIGGMADARLCYDAPFSFVELKGIQWFLGVEVMDGSSCLTGTHPEAHSSLWQISPNGLVWGKRQGHEFALVMADEFGTWGVQQLLEFPAEIESPSECLMWLSNEGLFVVNQAQLWHGKLDGSWSMVSPSMPDLAPYRSRGFVQSQNYFYSWSDNAGILIDKRSSQVVSFEGDHWPELMADFEILGATWRITGDYVEVINKEELLQFDFAEKALLMHQTIFSMPEPGDATWWGKVVGGGAPSPGWSLLWGLLAIAGLGLALYDRRRRGISMTSVVGLKQSNLGRAGDLAGSGVDAGIDYGFSDAFLEIVHLSSEVISMEEFDQLAHGGETLSPESQRARRSKLFREINAESKLVMGYDLLVRERDPQDRRKVRYRIQSLPPRIQRIVSAMKGQAPRMAQEPRREI